LRGVQLIEAADWWQKRLEELSSEERDFIQKSLALRHREKEERKRNRRRIVLGYVASLVVATILTGTAWMALNAVQSEAKISIDTGVTMQSHVFKMDAALKNARRLEREFFLLWPTIGFSKASQDYVQEHQQTIGDVFNISSRLQERLDGLYVDQISRQSDDDLQDYINKVEQYSRNFKEVVGLVSDLGFENVGCLAILEQFSTELKDSLPRATSPELMVSYQEMQSLEKEYLLTRQDSKMKLMSKAAQRLRNGISNSPKLKSVERERSLKALDAYESVIQEISKLNEQILSKIRNNIDVDTAAVSEKLLEVAKGQVEQARAAIDAKIQWSKGLLISAMLVVWSFMGAVRKRFFSVLKRQDSEGVTSNLKV
jgi:hypothetical protein